MSKSFINSSLAQAQPTVPSVTTLNSAVQQNQQQQQQASIMSTATTAASLINSIISTSVAVKPLVPTTNLLHSQLTKSVIRVKAPLTDDMNTSNNNSEDLRASASCTKSKNDVKQEQMLEVSDVNAITTSTLLGKSETSTSICKLSALQTPSSVGKMEDSQNVLLKQLLQNTACASTQSQPPVTTSTSTGNLPVIANLEAQLARPVPPTVTSLLPSILQNDNNNQQQQQQQQQLKSSSGQQQLTQVQQQQKVPLVARETSFVSKPVPVVATSSTVTNQTTAATPIPAPSNQQLHIDIKKCARRDDLLSPPPTPKSAYNSQESSLQTPPLVIKKEVGLLPLVQQSPQQLQQQQLQIHQQIPLQQEVKKELLDESSQHSEVSDHSKTDVQMKEEMMDLDAGVGGEKLSLSSFDAKEELKKLKRRQYQAKRRQIMSGSKEQQPKKRPRKSSKLDEDYDAYIDGVLAQLRTLPPMVVSEPVLNKNYNVVSVYGTDELNKVGVHDYNASCGELDGRYGNAIYISGSDFYRTKPYGDFDRVSDKPPASTQRGFYDQEFPLIRFDADDDKKFDLFFREDTPDSVISSSSPECPLLEPSSFHKFPGLKLIEDEEAAEENDRRSPVVPIIVPIPIRLQPSGPYFKDYADVDKENIEAKEHLNAKSKLNATAPLKESGNVTVTLTLTSSVAEDIMGVLRDLANILHIPPPTSYQIVERTSTPPSQKLGLYRTKSKDGKEGGKNKFTINCQNVTIVAFQLR